MPPSLKCGTSFFATVIRLINLCLLAPTVCLALCLQLNGFEQKNMHCPSHLRAVTLSGRWAGEIGQAPGLCDPIEKVVVLSGGDGAMLVASLTLGLVTAKSTFPRLSLAHRYHLPTHSSHQLLSAPGACQLVRVRTKSTPAEVSPPTWDRTSPGCDMEADRGPTIE